MGILASLMANVNRDSKRKPEPFTAKDFMVDWSKQFEPEPDEDDDSGMDPARVMAVMEGLMKEQERRLKSGG